MKVVRTLRNNDEITALNLIEKLPNGVFLCYPSKVDKIPYIIKRGSGVDIDKFRWLSIDFQTWIPWEYTDIRGWVEQCLFRGMELYWFRTEKEAIRFMASRLED